MRPTQISRVPRFRTRSEPRVLDFKRVVETIHLPKRRSARGVRGSPNCREPERFFVRAVAPVQEHGWRSWRGVIGHDHDVLIRERRIDERIVPGIMPRHPVANARRKLADLKIQSRILKWRVTEQILIKARIPVRPRTGIKAAIDPGLNQ